MKNLNCLFERVSNLGVGISLLFFALGLIIIGLTILPVFGILLAIPVLGGAIYFITAHLSKECRLPS